MACDSKARGSATILSLLISAVVITVGIGFNWLVKEHLRAAEGLKIKAEAMVKAQSAYNTLLYALLSGKTTSREVVFTTGADFLGIKSIPLDNTGVVVNEDIEIKLQDVNGLLSLTTVDLDALKRLIKNVQTGEDRSVTVGESFLDWTGNNPLVRPYGAGESYYRVEGRPYGPRHHPLQYKEEFSFIRGMDADLYRKISPFVTIMPNTGFNPNTASDEVLMAYLNIQGDTLGKIRAYMTGRPLSSNTELLTVAGRTLPGGMDMENFVPSQSCEITINVGKPHPVYWIRAGIDTLPGFNLPYSVVYWEQG